MIDGKNSLLPLLIFDAADTWNELHQLAEPELDSAGVGRLMEALSGKAKAVAVERHYIDKDYRDTFSNFPEVLVVDVGSALNQRQRLQKYPLQNSQLYPLYRSNLQ